MVNRIIKPKVWALFGVISFLTLWADGYVYAWEISGFVGIEDLAFVHEPLDPQQHNNYVSGVIEPELYHEWDDGLQSFAFVPFFIYAQHDSNRTHFDIRELTWLKVAQTWELRVGIRQEFWGVAESQHLVDIINQIDLVENADREDKLGQPMINFAYIQDWGTVDLFFLIGFRERTFPGVEGRLRTFPPINGDLARFEKDGAERELAYAIRWSHAIGDWDLGVSYFYGTNRDPHIVSELDQTGQVQLIPVYEQISQGGLDVQTTKGNWLWKLESIIRSSKRETYYAGTYGLEYTFFDIYSTGLDIGMVIEYLYDSRGKNAQTLFEDDFLVALRFGFNDVQSTEILAGVILDRTTSSKFYNLEASRRFGESWKLALEVRFFEGAPRFGPSFVFRDDDHIRTQLSYYF